MLAKNKVLSSIHHLLIAIVLLLKGFDKFHHHQILGSIIFCFGVIVLSYFIYLSVTRRESHTMHIVIHLFEAFASLLTAYIFYEEGKKYLQYMMLLAAVGFFISVFVYVKQIKHKER